MLQDLSHPPDVQPSPSQSFWRRWMKASVIGAAPGVLLALAGLAMPQIAGVTNVLLLLPGVVVGLGVSIGHLRVASSRLTIWWIVLNVLGYGLLWLWCLIIGKNMTKEFNGVLIGFGLLLVVWLFYLVAPQMLYLGKWCLPEPPESISFMYMEPIIYGLLFLALLLAGVPFAFIQSTLTGHVEQAIHSYRYLDPPSTLYLINSIALLIGVVAIQTGLVGNAISHR